MYDVVNLTHPFHIRQQVNLQVPCLLVVSNNVLFGVAAFPSPLALCRTRMFIKREAVTHNG